MIERFEFKYLVDERHLPTIRHAALAVGDRDGNAGGDGTYLIRSLYFDTYDLRLCEANEREAYDRFKVRARSYPANGTPFGAAPVFLEVKRRTGDVIRKTRGPVPPAHWDGIARGDTAAIDELRPGARRPVLAFVQKVLLHHLEPTELVQYRREAYASKVDLYARLTIDTEIVGQRPLGLTLEANERAWRPVDGPRSTDPRSLAILELKFQDTPPRWMSSLIHKLELRRLSFSKYGYSVEADRPPTAVRSAASRGLE